jgi:uncharacterized repeat protein (TIGR03803 family)
MSVVLRLWFAAFLLIAVALFPAHSSCAISWSYLHHFPTNSSPQAKLIRGQDGAFYGTTYTRPITDSYGTVFRVTTNGVFTNVFSFGYTNGAYLYAGLLQLDDGTLYGAAQNGGAHHYGTLFRLTTNGVLSTLLSFAGTNGAYPKGTLVLGRDGALYGTTHSGGASGVGTVFRVTTNGVHTVLASFNTNNGAYPFAGLVLARDGAFYGTTDSGGTNFPPLGTVFRVTTNGVLTTLFSFDGYQGANPRYGLTEGRDGRLYGTAYHGSGVAFAITTNGAYSILAAFDRSGAGIYPSSGLTQAADGSFYGTTTYDHVYRLTTNGLLSGLVAFYNYFGGQGPVGGVIVGSDRGLYGVTEQGGLHGGGVIYRVDLASQLLPLTRIDTEWSVLFYGVPAAAYRIQRARDAGSAWENMADVFTDDFGVGRWLDTSPFSDRALYRVIDP